MKSNTLTLTLSRPTGLRRAEAASAAQAGAGTARCAQKGSQPVGTTCASNGSPSPVRRERAGVRVVLTSALLLAVGFPRAFAQSPNSPDFASFKIISERNIFDPTRRPRVVSMPEAKIVDSFSLAGTLIYGAKHVAVFDGTSPDYRKVLEPGGSIAGYAVADISLNSVKLASGTNQMAMRVGTQMRRNEDGQWSVGEYTPSSGASSSSSSSRRRGTHRQSDATATQPDSNADASAAAPALGEPVPDQPIGISEGGEPDLRNAAPETANEDPNDPVARMMRRRAQELNGNDNRTPNQ